MGNGGTKKNNPTALRVMESLENEFVIGVICGGCHNIVTCVNGTVFAFGDNEFGQCLVPRNDENGDLLVPTEVNSAKFGVDKMKGFEIVACTNFSLIIVY